MYQRFKPQILRLRLERGALQTALRMTAKSGPFDAFRMTTGERSTSGLLPDQLGRRHVGAVLAAAHGRGDAGALGYGENPVRGGQLHVLDFAGRPVNLGGAGVGRVSEAEVGTP